MHRFARSLIFPVGLLSALGIVSSTPAPQTTGSPSTACDEDPSSCNRPPDASIYICENISWQPPCHLFELDTVNNAEYGWASGPSIWPDGSYTVGSWGPAPGVLTQLSSMFNQNSTSPTDPTYTYPGTPDVGPFWRNNIYQFTAGWDPHTDPSSLPKTVGAAPAATSTGSQMKMRKVTGDEHPWWVQKVYFN